jgi:hypothetical protein
MINGGRSRSTVAPPNKITIYARSTWDDIVLWLRRQQIRGADVSSVGRRPGRHHWQALAGILVLLALLVAWVVSRIASQDVRSGSVASSAALVGTWKLQGGAGQIRLGADGRFSATALPNQLFGLDPSRNGVTSAAGTWTLGGRGGYVALALNGAPLSAQSDIGLGVVETGGSDHLCIFSTSPGAMCDFLLQHVHE